LSETISEKNLNRPALEENIREFILDRSFPCVGAKSAVQNGRLTVYVARSIESSWDDVAIQERLMRFAWDYTQEPALFTSFAVIFEGPDRLSEEEFENSLWDRVQSLTDKDA
jgi:FPC/CPF motif-containing protein YcgG